MDKTHTIQDFFIFGLLILLFVCLVCMLYPFWSVILWTILLYILIRPLYRKCTGKLDQSKKGYEAKRHLFAGLFAVGTLILIITPLVFLTIQLFHQAVSFLKASEEFIRTHPDFFSSAIEKAREYAAQAGVTIPGLQADNLKDNILSILHTYSSQALDMGKSFLGQTGTFVISLLFVVFSLYFCFLDGAYLTSLVKKAIPIKPDYMKVLLSKFTDITANLFAGYILVALYQGAASFIIMSIFHVKGALLFSVLLLFASFIPLFGAALVWFPIGLVICFTVSIPAGIVFLVLSAVFVSLFDNFLRPFFLKDRIHVHPLVIFFAILGGLKLFGMNGLILGPMIVILFFTVLDLLANTKDQKTVEDDSEKKQ
jgi:predicted PurR-regulated permease PerM